MVGSNSSRLLGRSAERGRATEDVVDGEHEFVGHVRLGGLDRLGLYGTLAEAADLGGEDQGAGSEERADRSVSSVDASGGGGPTSHECRRLSWWNACEVNEYPAGYVYFFQGAWRDRTWPWTKVPIGESSADARDGDRGREGEADRRDGDQPHGACR